MHPATCRQRPAGEGPCRPHNRERKSHPAAPRAPRGAPHWGQPSAPGTAGLTHGVVRPAPAATSGTLLLEPVRQGHRLPASGKAGEGRGPATLRHQHTHVHTSTPCTHTHAPHPCTPPRAHPRTHAHGAPHSPSRPQGPETPAPRCREKACPGPGLAAETCSPAPGSVTAPKCHRPAEARPVPGGAWQVPETPRRRDLLSGRRRPGGSGSSRAELSPAEIKLS